MMPALLAAKSGTPTDAILSVYPVSAAPVSIANNGYNFIGYEYQNGVYLFVGYNSSSAAIRVSSDGITWTTVTNPFGNVAVSVCSGNGLFVAVSRTAAYNFSIWYSVNGVNWNFIFGISVQTSSVAPQIVYVNNKFLVFVGTDVFQSTDGTTWVYTGSLGITADCIEVAYGNGMYVASRASGTGRNYNTSCLYSSDLVTWTEVQDLNINVLGRLSIVFANNKFWLLTGYSDGTYYRLRVSQSDDGISFSDVQTTGFDNFLSIALNDVFGTYQTLIAKIGFVNNTFVLSYHAGFLFSKNGSDWTSNSTFGNLSSFIETINPIGTKIKQLNYNLFSANQYLFSSRNISKKLNQWKLQAISNTTGQSVSCHRFTNQKYFIGTIAPSGDYPYLASSTDGINYTWVKLTSFPIQGEIIRDIIYSNNLYHIATQTAIYRSSDLITWTSSVALPSTPDALSSHPYGYLRDFSIQNGVLVANNGLYSIDGINWSRPSALNSGSLIESKILYFQGAWYIYSALAANGGATGVYSSSDLITWTKVSSVSMAYASTTATNGSIVVAMPFSTGTSGTFRYSTNGYTFTNGKTFTNYGLGVVYANGKFLALFRNASQLCYSIQESIDGINWGIPYQISETRITSYTAYDFFSLAIGVDNFVFGTRSITT